MYLLSIASKFDGGCFQVDGFSFFPPPPLLFENIFSGDKSPPEKNC